MSYFSRNGRSWLLGTANRHSSQCSLHCTTSINIGKRKHRHLDFIAACTHLLCMPACGLGRSSEILWPVEREPAARMPVLTKLIQAKLGRHTWTTGRLYYIHHILPVKCRAFSIVEFAYKILPFTSASQIVSNQATGTRATHCQRDSTYLL